jgi:hypothetical protein
MNNGPHGRNTFSNTPLRTVAPRKHPYTMTKAVQNKNLLRELRSCIGEDAAIKNAPTTMMHMPPKTRSDHEFAGTIAR